MSEAWQQAVMKAAEYNKMNYLDERLVLGMGEDNYVLFKENGNMDVGKAVAGIFITKNYTGPHFALTGKADLVNIHSGKKNLETVDFSVLSAEAKAEISHMFVGAGVSLKLAGGSYGIFDSNLGFGVSTGVGIKDDSAEIKVLGWGVSVGRKMEISVFDCSLGVDFGRLFN